MRPGVVIWVLGSEAKLAAAGAMVRDALKDLFAAVEVFSRKDADVERLGRQCLETERRGGAAVVLSHASKRRERDALRKSAGSMIEVLLKGDPPPDLEPPFYPEVEIAEGDGEAEVKAGLMSALKSVGLLDESSGGYDEDEEKLVRDRLEKLGYL
jgi:hypothetical protein